MQKAVQVNFHGTELYGIKLGGITLIAVKPIVIAMGLSWHGQYERIRRDPLLSKGIRVTRIPFGRGGPQDTVCLPLDLIHGWFFTLSSLRIKDLELRERVQLFQRECYDVLYRHFSGQQLIQSPGYERRSIEMVHEARLLFGRRAAAQVWRSRQLPIASEMDDAFRQLDLFDKDQAA